MFKAKVLTSLTKVFFDEEPKAVEIDKLSLLKNERSSFQIALFSSKTQNVKLSLSSDIKKYCRIYEVREVYSGLPCNDNADDFFLRKNAGNYPDLLLDIEDNIKLTKDKYCSVWVEIDPNSELAAGEYTLGIDFIGSDFKKVKKISIEIINAFLPEQELLCTNWFHTDCLADYYNIEIFSEEYWRTVENYLRVAVKHGINFILTPLFTPPLDTEAFCERPTVQLVDVEQKGKQYFFGFDKLKRWVKLSRSCGVKKFEMSHLFTQWGAKHAPKIMAEVKGEYKRIFGWETPADSEKYFDFLKQFSQALKPVLKELGVEKDCYFHVSDEPGQEHYNSYKKSAETIQLLFGEYPVIDAMSDYKFYENGLCKIPITADDCLDDFIGKTDEFWTYYCCGQQTKNVPNRFIAMPSERNRILGLLLYKYDAVGFLQWGFNFWYTRYSKRLVDPFKETDAGGEFPSGDSFVVYPSPDFTPLCSLRLKVFYDAIQDLRALKLLEKLTDKKAVKAILEENLLKPLSFYDYPHGEKWIFEKRMEINKKIKEAL